MTTPGRCKVQILKNTKYGLSVAQCIAGAGLSKFSGTQQVLEGVQVDGCNQKENCCN